MKVFRKMFAFAVTVAAMAMATSAFAATASYDATNVLVKVDDVTALTETAQMTVAVVPTNFGETDAEIYYINQDNAATIKAELVDGLAVKEAITVPTNYEVRVAGTSMNMQKIAFAAIQEPDEDEYEIIGTNLESAKVVGIKGAFSVNAGVDKVYVTLKDANNNNAQGTIEWDLSEFDIVTNADITFGLEIHSATPRNLSGISIVNVSDVNPGV